MAEPIPDSWRNEVVQILKTQDRRLIHWTLTARGDWQIFGFEYEAYDAMIATLSKSVLGNQVGMIGGKESYEFLFLHNGITMYAKMALLKDEPGILIISAHRAKRPSL
jgi:hypothetical protein